MAKATRHDPTYTLTLDLNREEAETLRSVCEWIGGSPTGSRRKHMDAISRALDECEVQCCADDIDEADRAIYFKSN